MTLHIWFTHTLIIRTSRNIQVIMCGVWPCTLCTSRSLSLSHVHTRTKNTYKIGCSIKCKFYIKCRKQVQNRCVIWTWTGMLGFYWYIFYFKLNITLQKHLISNCFLHYNFKSTCKYRVAYKLRTFILPSKSMLTESKVLTSEG